MRLQRPLELFVFLIAGLEINAGIVGRRIELFNRDPFDLNACYLHNVPSFHKNLPHFGALTGIKIAPLGVRGAFFAFTDP